MASINTGNRAAPERPGIDPAGMRVIWLLLIAAFVAILNETTMGIAIPHLNADLGVPPELGQWLTSAFMLTMAAVIPTTGFILERFTTRQVFLAASGAFALGTLICLTAPGFLMLLVGRIVQAMGTGVMMPLLMTTIMNVVPPSSRGRMMGRVGLVISLAPAVGPTLAGAVLDTLGWRWLFAIVLPIALASLAIGARWMTNLGVTTRVPIDVVSVVLSALGFGGIVYGLSRFGEAGAADAAGASPVLVGAIAVGVGAVVLGAFVWRQLVLQRSDRALLDLRVFRSTTFSISIIIMTIVALAMFGTLTLLPQYLQNVAGLDALRTGLVLLPGSVLMGLLGPLMGRIYDARGPRILLVPGTVLVTATLFFYTTVTPATEPITIAAAQTAMFVGMAMSFTPLFSTSLGSLEPRLYPHGSAVLNTVQQVGGAIGVAVLIGIYSSALHSAAAAGIPVVEGGAAGARLAFLVAACVSSATVVLAFFLRRSEGEGEAEAEAESPRPVPRPAAVITD